MELDVRVAHGEGAEHALPCREGGLGAGVVTVKAVGDLAHGPMIAGRCDGTKSGTGPAGDRVPAFVGYLRPMPW
jgi:hypothetical protein